VSGRADDVAMVIGIEDIEELGSVLTIWAHPDDESYLVGGLMAAVAARAQRVGCLTMTAGELGTSPAHPDPDVLGHLRRQELRNALGKLGVREHEVFGLPDGGCAELGEDAPIARLHHAIEQFAPDTIVTFGPDGVTGHPDHCAVSRWVDVAVEGVRRPPRVLHPVSTPRWIEEFRDVFDDLGLDPGAGARCAPESLAVHLTLDAERLARKLAALRAHVTQTGPVFRTVDLPRLAEWLRDETFVLSAAAAARAA
jgi:LmbE family N-acetylglucosaminyl deacetylase